MNGINIADVYHLMRKLLNISSEIGKVIIMGLGVPWLMLTATVQT